MFKTKQGHGTQATRKHCFPTLSQFLKSDQGELDIDLKELMAFQLTTIPYSLGTADGFLFQD